jgi:hypothetical protein
MDHPRGPHYLLLPVTLTKQLRSRDAKPHYAVRPFRGQRALRVNRGDHPELFRQLTQFRGLQRGDPVPTERVMTGELSDGSGHVTLVYLKQRSPADYPGLFLVVDGKGTTYMVRLLEGERHEHWYRNGPGSVMTVHSEPRAPAAGGTSENPVVVAEERAIKVKVKRRHQRADDRDERMRQREAHEVQAQVAEALALEEQPLEELPAPLAPELNEHPLSVDVLHDLKPVVPVRADNESTFTMQTVNALIGQMSDMTPDVNRETRIQWALYMLQHNLRLHLDNEVGRAVNEDALRQWPKRFETFRGLYEHGASVLLNSQHMYGPHDIPGFAENVHDELHPHVLHMRCYAVFAPDERIRAIACKASGVETTMDQGDVLTALFLQFCRRHHGNAYYVRDEQGKYLADYRRLAHALYEERIETTVAAHMDDYAERLLHPRPQAFDPYHPLFSDEELSQFREMELEHEENEREAARDFAEQERSEYARLKLKRDREAEEAAAREAAGRGDIPEYGAVTPASKKQAGATPKGSPNLPAEVMICASIQRLASRLMGPPRTQTKPSKAVAQATPAVTVKDKAPTPAAVSQDKEKASKTAPAVMPAGDIKLPTLASVKAALEARPRIEATILPVCSVCKTPGAMARCPSCKVAYCGVNCQEKDWDADHATRCK